MTLLNLHYLPKCGHLSFHVCWKFFKRLQMPITLAPNIINYQRTCYSDIIDTFGDRLLQFVCNMRQSVNERNQINIRLIVSFASSKLILCIIVISFVCCLVIRFIENIIDLYVYSIFIVLYRLRCLLGTHRRNLIQFQNVRVIERNKMNRFTTDM